MVLGSHASRLGGARSSCDGRLVYVAAMLLGCKEVFTDVSVAFPASQLGAALVIGDGGMFTVDPAAATACFYNACSREDAEAAVAQLRSTSLGCVTVPSNAEPWRHIPSTYVVCERDNAIHPEMQRMMAKRASRIVVIDTDHSPFMSTPTAMLEVLVESMSTETD